MQEFPKHPVKSAVSMGHWVPVSISQTCTCGEISHVDVPRRNTDSVCNLYGDEAERVFEPNGLPGVDNASHFFCITLCGCHQKAASRLQNRIRRIKRDLRPTQSPDDWRFHYKEFWGTHTDSADYAVESLNDKIVFGKKFAKVIRDARPELFTLTLGSCRIAQANDQWSKLVRQHKQDVFATALLSSLEQVRSRELGVRWHFDHNVPPDKRTGEEGWAEEVFLGLQYMPLFTYLSSGSTVLSPTFREPGSHFLLEVADIMSFLAAREFHTRAVKRDCEVPTSLTGVGFYQAVLQHGVEPAWSRGFPFKKFFPELV